jgi:hypothetical protein
MHHFFLPSLGGVRLTVWAVLGLMLAPTWAVAEPISIFSWIAQIGRQRVWSTDVPTPPLTNSYERTRVSPMYRFDLESKYAVSPVGPAVTARVNGSSSITDLGEPPEYSAKVDSGDSEKSYASMQYEVRFTNKMGNSRFDPYYVPVRIKTFSIAEVYASPSANAYALARGVAYGDIYEDKDGKIPWKGTRTLRYGTEVSVVSGVDWPNSPASPAWDKKHVLTNDLVYVKVGPRPDDYQTLNFWDEVIAEVGVSISAYSPPGDRSWTSVAGRGDAWAHVDPQIEIDPSWEFAQWFEIECSPGVVLAIPEPSALALLAAIAFAMLCRRERHRSTAKHSAAA